jgi:hypothetical protein
MGVHPKMPHPPALAGLGKATWYHPPGKGRYGGWGKWWDFAVWNKAEGRKLEAWEMGKYSRTHNLSVRLRQGTYQGTPYQGAPSKVGSVKQAKIAAGWAYKNGRPAADNQGWSPQQVGLEWSGAPWAKKRSIKSIIDAAMKSGISAQAKAYLIGVRGRSTGTKAAPGVYSKWATPKVTKAKKAREKRRRSAAPVQGPREDTSQFVSASSPFLAPGSGQAPGGRWWETKQAKVGAGVGLGILVLVVILAMGGRRR